MISNKKIEHKVQLGFRVSLGNGQLEFPGTYLRHFARFARLIRLLITRRKCYK